jgi:glutaredoxin 3
MITLYTTPTCKNCVVIKNFLNSRGKSYAEIDVSKSPEKVAYIREKTGFARVPVTAIDGHFIVGTDENALKSLAELLK